MHFIDNVFEFVLSFALQRKKKWKEFKTNSYEQLKDKCQRVFSRLSRSLHNHVSPAHALQMGFHPSMYILLPFFLSQVTTQFVPISSADNWAEKRTKISVLVFITGQK
ncbi:hypothetical protein B566_EDAN002094 [Ephemera danica]|nr:hypothetical protein B566_EDAN002094 [Ephemera danica]